MNCDTPPMGKVKRIPMWSITCKETLFVRFVGHLRGDCIVRWSRILFIESIIIQAREEPLEVCHVSNITHATRRAMGTKPMWEYGDMFLGREITYSQLEN